MKITFLVTIEAPRREIQHYLEEKQCIPAGTAFEQYAHALELGDFIDGFDYDSTIKEIEK